MSLCSDIFLTCLPIATSHALTVLSGEAVTIRLLSADHWSSRIAFLWPVSTEKFSHSVSNARQSQTDRSRPALAKRSPSVLNLHVNTSPLCPSKRIIGACRDDVRLTPCKSNMITLHGVIPTEEYSCNAVTAVQLGPVTGWCRQCDRTEPDLKVTVPRDNCPSRA